jgi:hypothetical protein
MLFKVSASMLVGSVSEIIILDKPGDWGFDAERSYSSQAKKRTIVVNIYVPANTVEIIDSGSIIIARYRELEIYMNKAENRLKIANLEEFRASTVSIQLEDGKFIKIYSTNDQDIYVRIKR